ncbi:MAG TPA: hypothetical protein VKR31_03955 [Rhizomicrobium sp.]|nr:hypothetical protein [Rhizomicrobium sp.]
MHSSTYSYLIPSEEERDRMNRVRAAAKEYSDTLEGALPDGPDKTYVLRTLRTVAMWACIAITRHPDGTPRSNP